MSSPPFSVSFVGELGTGDGLFRESLFCMIQDLYNPLFPLFLKTENHTNNDGDWNEAYIPNPLYNTYYYGPIFNFIGKLIGISFKEHLCLPLNFPPFLWSYLVEGVIDYTLYETVDHSLYEEVTYLKNISTYSEEEQSILLENKYLCYVKYDGTVCYYAAKEPHSLVSESEKVPLTKELIPLYIKMIKLNIAKSYESSLAQIRNGLLELLSSRVLSLLSWNELYVRCAGKNDVDIQLLKQHTSYEYMVFL